MSPSARPPASGLAHAVTRARSSRRLAIFLVAYLVLTGAIGWRLVTVQVVSADEYRELAERQVQREVAVPARRGKIYDRDGEALAMSLPAASVYADPRVIAAAEVDPTFIAADLEPLLDHTMDELMEALTRDAGFVYLGRQLPRAVGDQIRSMRLPGIGVLEEPKRSYPADGLASQVVGFAGLDGDGLAGIELRDDDLLAGTPGLLRQERAPGGVAISAAPQEVEPPEPGDDVVLTIDRSIQHHAERVLADAIAAQDARGGSAVVLDVDSGDILAMASAPAFDPEAEEGSAYSRRNRAVTDVFEPGSVNKAITLAAALDDGVIAPDASMHVPESVTVGGKRFTDSTPQPAQSLTVTEIMARSSNVGTIQIAEQLGDEALREYLERFGFGAATGLDFPGESHGIVPSPDAWYATTRPTVAIGQGVSASLLQVAGVFGALASDGERVEPRLVRGTVDADGRLVEAPEPERHRAVAPETAGAVAEMLTAVVEDGTGGRAAVPGYRVAGKTGTAQKPSPTSRGYEEGAYIATFAGFAPAEDPELVVAVMIDEPGEAIYGGEVAAPVFAELMEFALGQRRVPPSEDGSREDGSREDAATADAAG